MSSQLPLPGLGFAPKRQRLDGVYFAVKPEMAAASDIEHLAAREKHRHRLKGRPIAPECLHATLYFLGREHIPRAALVFAALRAGAAVAMPPFEIAFDRLESFLTKPDNVPLVLRGDDGLAGLMMLYRHLGEAMEKVGLGHYVQPHYTPHVTLLYGDRPIAEQRVETIGWKVREFVLVRSLYGKGTHIELGRWPLHASV